MLSMPAKTGKSTQQRRRSDLGMVEAQDWQTDAERAPERLTEERSTSQVGQVGSGGWLPRPKQLRDSGKLIRLSSKEGGTARVDASRPFGSRRIASAQRLVSDESRRETIVNDLSAIGSTTQPAEAEDRVLGQSPRLRPVPSASDDLDSASYMRTLSLGGALAPKLSTFTLSARLRGRSLVDDIDLTPDEIIEVLETAGRLKRMHKKGEPHGYLPGKTLGMIFQHPSTRTRVSFEAGMAQLGGNAIFLGVNDLQLKRGETIEDTARIIGGYVDCIVARVAKHEDIVALAENAGVPVINGLSDRSHPTQALADLLTLKEQFGDLKGVKLTYLGDGNNVAASLLICGAAAGVSVTIACPTHYQPPADIVTQATWLAAASGAKVAITDQPHDAVVGADAVYTDVHVSMGQLDGAARAVALAPFKVTDAIMAAAKKDAIFMHCLPMHRDEEVAASVADGPQSVIFDQAENRMHLHKALLLHMLC